MCLLTLAFVTQGASQPSIHPLIGTVTPTASVCLLVVACILIRDIQDGRRRQTSSDPSKPAAPQINECEWFIFPNYSIGTSPWIQDPSAVSFYCRETSVGALFTFRQLSLDEDVCAPHVVQLHRLNHRIGGHRNHLHSRVRHFTWLAIKSNCLATGPQWF